jgi:aspartate aminotransferase/aminotransferase
MDFLAERMLWIDASGIRKVFALAATLKDPINLSIGQPDYDVDEVVKQTAIQSITQGFNGYTQTNGIPELRQACADYYQRRFGVTLENVIITSGVSGGLFLSLLATVNPGDEVIFADPYFVMYPHLTRLLGGKPVPVSTYPNFRLTPEAVEKAITPRSKILIVNSPANPTGITLTTEELSALADVARKHNLLVISDEIYEALSYDQPAATMAGLYENTLVLNGFSKSAGMTGWRIGYAAGPAPIIEAMNTLQQYTFVCAPSFAQRAAVTALQQDMTQKVHAYRRKRDMLYEGLCSRFHIVKPGGAFYMYVEAPNGDGDAFVKAAIERGLLIIPGSVFSSEKTHFRVSYAAADATLKRGIELLRKLADEL